MTNLPDVVRAVNLFRHHGHPVGVLACTSKYPAPIETLNLARIKTIDELFPWAVPGYSGHEVGLWTTLAAIGVGARIIERHITLDRSMSGTDQAASIEPPGFKLLVREARNFEKAYSSL